VSFIPARQVLLFVHLFDPDATLSQSRRSRAALATGLRHLGVSLAGLDVAASVALLAAGGALDALTLMKKHRCPARIDATPFVAAAVVALPASVAALLWQLRFPSSRTPCERAPYAWSSSTKGQESDPPSDDDDDGDGRLLEEAGLGRGSTPGAADDDEYLSEETRTSGDGDHVYVGGLGGRLPSSPPGVASW